MNYHPRFQIISSDNPSPPVVEQFSAPKSVERVFARHGLAIGRCLGSKSDYRAAHPGHRFLPNANVFCRKRGKLWFGDLDLDLDKPRLQTVARSLRTRLYVLSELDGRFGNSSIDHSKMITWAVWQTGGRVRIPGLAAAARAAGLSLSEVACLLFMTRRKLLGRHEPGRALRLRRVLEELRFFITLWLPKSYRGQWGQWLTAPNSQLKGLTPLEHFRRHKKLYLAELLEVDFPSRPAATPAKKGR